MKIDFVSDVSCPWCAVGLASLDIALQRLGDAVPVELHFHPFELNPQMGPEGENTLEHLSRKYGKPPEQLLANQQALIDRGAAVGFPFQLDKRQRIYNTFDAHRLLHWAAEWGLQAELKRSLFLAYFHEGLDPSDHTVLVQRAAAVGLDAQAARAVLGSQAYAAEVRAQEQHWQGLGIQSVPAIILNDQYLISGGQPPEVFEQALRQVAAQG